MPFAPLAVEVLMSALTFLVAYRHSRHPVNEPNRACGLERGEHHRRMTPPNIYVPSRRGFFKGMALAAAYMSVPGAFAEALMLTPKQTEGPFYPDHLPLDTDNDLIVVNDGVTPAVGTITHLTGRVLDSKGEPIRNAVVEIWQ